MAVSMCDNDILITKVGYMGHDQN